VHLQPLAFWDCRFETRRVHGCLSLVIVVCCWEGPITRPECGVSEWMWPWSFDCEEALAHSGLFARGKLSRCQYIAPLTVISTDFRSPLIYHANYFSYCTSVPLVLFLQTKFVFLLEVNLPSFYGMFITQSKPESHQQQLKLININRQHLLLRWENLSYQYEHNLTGTFTSALTFWNYTRIWVRRYELY
jgi:hypothetical protein